MLHISVQFMVTMFIYWAELYVLYGINKKKKLQHSLVRRLVLTGNPFLHLTHPPVHRNRRKPAGAQADLTLPSKAAVDEQSFLTLSTHMHFIPLPTVKMSLCTPLKHSAGSRGLFLLIVSLSANCRRLVSFTFRLIDHGEETSDKH